VTALLLAAAVAVKAAAMAPPQTLNIVHHKLKRHAQASYQTLEASIVTAYDRAKAPLYWVTFQSVTDPRDVLYLNVFNTPDDLKRATASYDALAPAHPELARLTTRLASMIEAQTTLLTTRRDEVPYTRTDVDFSTMRALRLATFEVKAGHEGQFVDAIRQAGGGGAPWIIYESTANPTFVLLWPLRTRADARHASIPRPLRELRRAYKRTDVGVYAIAPSMSRVPVEFFAKAHSASPKPKAH